MTLVDRDQQLCDAIIAARATLIGHNSGPFSRQDLDTKSYSFRPAGTPGDRGTNIRTCRVMDALASLCVSDRRYQVVALAVRLDFKSR